MISTIWNVVVLVSAAVTVVSGIGLLIALIAGDPVDEDHLGYRS